MFTLKNACGLNRSFLTRFMTYAYMYLWWADNFASQQKRNAVAQVLDERK